MDTALPRRIVRVEAKFPGNRCKRGTGLRLDSEWILTSQHILEHIEKGERLKATEIAVELAAPAGGDAPRAPAQLAWCGEESLDTDDLLALDVALLKVQGLPAESGEPIRFVPLHLPTADCEAAGWIRASALGNELIAPEEFSGQFSAIDEAATLLPVRLDGLEPKTLPEDPFSPFGGVSGAPVFVKSGRYAGWLYGVIRKGPKNQPDRLFAVSTPALLRNARFCELLGIVEPPPPHEKLILSTRRLLDGSPALAWNLARAEKSWRAAWEAKGTEGGVDGLIAALCEGGDLRSLLTAIEELAKAAQDGSEVESLRQWAAHFTGLLAHRYFAAKGFTIERDGNRQRVPLNSQGYAEAVLASEHGEAPRYEAREKVQVPKFQVPATTLEAGIPNRRQARDQMESLADLMLRKDLATSRYLLPSELNIIEGETTNQFETRVEVIKLALQNFCEENETSRRPYLLIQPHLRKNSPAEVLDGFLTYMADLLPQLEQVELHGDGIESARLEDQLKPLWRILNIGVGEK